MELKDNQSALILEVDDNGEITVNVASPDIDGLTASICTALATKLMSDEQLQEEFMTMLEEEQDIE